MAKKMGSDTQVAIIQTKLDDIKIEIAEIKTSIKEITSKYLTKEEAEQKLQSGCQKISAIEERLTDRIKRMETIVYGMIGIILTGFMGALITMVYKK